LRIRFLSFFLVFALLFPLFPGNASGNSKPDAIDLIDTTNMISGYREAEGIGRWRYYAQNDPTWGKMSFRFPHQKDILPVFSGTGCVPSAVANVIANMVPAERLPSLSSLTWKSRGFYICPCSMNRTDCEGTHNRYLLKTEEDFERYLSLAIGSYFSGNNTVQEYACGTMYLTGRIFKHFGLRYDYNVTIQEAVRAVENEGAMAVFMVGGETNVFTSSGHALVLCAVSDDMLYILDSFSRVQEEYLNYPGRVMKVIEPGLVAFDRSKLYRLEAYQIYVVYPLAQ